MSARSSSTVKRMRGWRGRFEEKGVLVWYQGEGAEWNGRQTGSEKHEKIVGVGCSTMHNQVVIEDVNLDMLASLCILLPAMRYPISRQFAC